LGRLVRPAGPDRRASEVSLKGQHTVELVRSTELAVHFVRVGKSSRAGRPCRMGQRDQPEGRDGRSSRTSPKCQRVRSIVSAASTGHGIGAGRSGRSGRPVVSVGPADWVSSSVGKVRKSRIPGPPRHAFQRVSLSVQKAVADGPPNRYNGAARTAEWPSRVRRKSWDC